MVIYLHMHFWDTFFLVPLKDFQLPELTLLGLQHNLSSKFRLLVPTWSVSNYWWKEPEAKHPKTDVGFESQQGWETVQQQMSQFFPSRAQNTKTKKNKTKT